MDYNQTNCKNYFNLNNSTFYYETPPLNELTNECNKITICESFIDNSTDYNFKQPYFDQSTVDALYQSNHNLTDDHSYTDADFHSTAVSNRNGHSSFFTNNYNYPIASNWTDHQTHSNELSNSVLHTTNQLNTIPTSFNTATTESTTLQPIQIQSGTASTGGGQTNSAAQTKQLSVNLSMNMTMDIKSMNTGQATNGSDHSNYNHVMNDVVSNVANKLVTNLNSNLLSPTSQKEYLPLCHQQAYSHPTSKTPYSFYNSQNNPNYYNQRYHNQIHNSGHYATIESNHILEHQYPNGSFDELAQLKHFNNSQHNDCYELTVYNPVNCNESNNSSTLASNLNSLNSSFSNGSLSSNDLNNDYLINNSNNFLNSIGNKSIGFNSNANDLETPLKPNRRKLQKLNFNSQAYNSNPDIENGDQKTYFKIERESLMNLKKEKPQDLNTFLRVRSNENRKDIDFYQIDSNDKGGRMKMLNNSRNSNLCLLCNKSYARPSTLKTHLRTHSNERPYNCSFCSKRFSQAANLTAHLRTHSGEKPFECEICNRKFSQSSSVTTHRRTHSGDRPYSCTYCGKAFSDSSTLTKHLRIHSGDKPYQCRLCGLKFSQSGNLNRHMRIHNFNQ